MVKINKKTSRGPMVHIRLNNETHKNLKIYVAQTGKTIQQFVEELISNKIIKLESKSVKK